MAIEANRRAKPYNMGTLYWQLNDVWPVISWSSVDYYGEWKALQYRTKELYKNIMLSAFPNSINNTYDIFIVSDYQNVVSGTLIVNITDFVASNFVHTVQAINVTPGVSLVY